MKNNNTFGATYHRFVISSPLKKVQSQLATKDIGTGTTKGPKFTLIGGSVSTRVFLPRTPGQFDHTGIVHVEFGHLPEFILTLWIDSGLDECSPG